MKISLLNRVLLTLYTIVIIIVSLFLMAVAVGIIPFNQIVNTLTNIDYGWDVAVVLAIVSLVFLLISLKLLFSGTERNKVTGTLLKHTDLGMIKVSINTLDTLTQKAVRNFQEVKDVKSLVVPEIDGIKVRLIILLMPDVNIPTITQSVQSKVKEYIESTAGILVKEVEIYVDNLAALQRSRVE